MKTTPPMPDSDAQPNPPAPASAPTPAPASRRAGRVRRAVPRAANDALRGGDAMRGGDARAIADLMPAVGATSFRKFGFIQSAIVTRWADIVGERFGGITRPDALRFPQGQKADGTLQLTIAGAHAPMLQHVAPELIDRVNRFFGYRAVARVRMTQGLVVTPSPSPQSAPQPAPQPASQSAPQPAPVPAPAVQPSLSVVRAPDAPRDGLIAVADDELRTVLERMAARLDDPPRLPRIS